MGVELFFMSRVLGLMVGVIKFKLLRSGDGDCKGTVDGITLKSMSMEIGLVRIR